ncbi:WD and tetratricopeptide repeats protein 1-like [Styela clava]
MEQGTFQQCMRREHSSAYARGFQRRNHVNQHFVHNLQLECILEGHSGCVNCLDWNDEGTLLASGSDDTKVILWDAYQHKNIQMLNTQHHGNIFTVKFIPCSNDHVIATGAADGHIFLHDLIGKETISAYDVQGRIKRIVTTKAEPNVLISASEDGIIREYDIREPSSSSARVLVDLTKCCGSNIECKCVDISPSNPNCIAVGANDSYLRLYDRRMFDMHKRGTYFTPGHLRSKQNEYRKKLRNLCITYLTFNPRGDEVLVNFGGEQIYIFDIYDKVKPLLLESKIQQATNGIRKQSSNGLKDAGHAPKRHKSSSSEASTSNDLSSKNSMASDDKSDSYTADTKTNVFSDNCRLKGNDYFGEKQFSAAVAMYNKALLMSPKSVVYSNRAAALIKREWDGDFYAALRDCYSALHVNPSDVKAHYRLARCMFELEWFEEASSCIKEFKQHHPEHSSSNACVALEKDISVALKRKENGKKIKKNDNSSEEEIEQRSSCFDYKYRYCGHCNTTTDIKEANFFGDNGQYIIAGSDEGSFYMWEHDSTNLVRIMTADSSIVNCVQPHPSSCLLATSGIDPEIKLWSPKLYENKQENVIEDMNSVAADNQRRMNTDPLESMLLSMGMRFVSSDDESGNSSDNNVMPCRPT